jgi:hypothetical protein
VTVRTLDIGGDKILPYMKALEEENPALGWRRRGHPLGDHELQLGAEQADALGSGLVQVREVDEESRSGPARRSRRPMPRRRACAPAARSSTAACATCP